MTHIFIYTYTYIYIYIYIYTYVYINVYICTCIHIYVHVYIYVYIYIFMGNASRCSLAHVLAHPGAIHITQTSVVALAICNLPRHIIHNVTHDSYSAIPYEQCAHVCNTNSISLSNTCARMSQSQTTTHVQEP